MSTNRRVLIDNATLSGVERITGTSQTLNLRNTDNDILCLERLITAILFSDELIGVDDYKDEYRSKRFKNFEFIRFKKIDQEKYNSFAAESATFARSMTTSFEGAEPAGDIVQFFESLRIDTQLRWNVWVSSEYLTLSHLVDEPRYAFYEKSVDSMFRTEVTDCELVSSETDHSPAFKIEGHPGIKEVKDFVRALAEANPQFKGMDHRGTLGRVLFGYGWAAERSHFYNAVAHAEGANTSLAPLREAFCESCCRIDYPDQVDALISALKKTSQRTLSAILEPSGQSKFVLRLPFFSAYLISKVDTPSECIDLALHMRGEPELRECRTIFHNLDHLSAGERLKEVNGILKYLEQSCDKLMRKYAVSTGGGIQSSISLGLSGISVGLETKISHLFRSYKNEPFSRVFRNISQDMLNVEQLGGLYEKLCCSVRKHKDATYTDIATTPRFMKDRGNEYGRPAKL